MQHTKSLHNYCEQLTGPIPDVLRELERETHLKTLAPQMMTGHLQGRLLSFISRMKRPRVVVEIGTFTGYGAICMAEGLADDGRVYTLEANKELGHIIRKYIAKSNNEHRISSILGKAEDHLDQLPDYFDLVYLDAGKQYYSFFYDLIIERMNPGGLILADNVLWSGKVVTEPNDADTRFIHAFNEKVANDERVQQMILPVRDGLLIAERLDVR